MANPNDRNGNPVVVGNDYFVAGPLREVDVNDVMVVPGEGRGIRVSAADTVPVPDGLGAAPADVDKDLTYNGDGSVDTVTYGGVDVWTFVYNPDGTVATFGNGTRLKTFVYNPDGTLASVTNT